MKELIKYLIATVFLISALAKLVDFKNTIDFFFNVSQLDYSIVKILIVTIILFELVIVFFLVKELYTLNTIYVSIILLLFFFILLNAIFLYLEIENCGCFGTKIITNPLISLIKNMMMIVLLIFLKKNTKGVKYA